MKRKLLIIMIVLLISTNFGFNKINDVKSEKINEKNIEFIVEQILNYNWPQIFDGGPEESASKMTIDSKDNIIVTGYSYNTTTDRLNILTIKYDKDGNEIWNVCYDSGG